MIKKLFRIIFTIIGGLVGYGTSRLSLLLVEVYFSDSVINFTPIHHIIITIIFVLIFALLFFALAPIFNRQSKNMAKNIESELQKVSGHDLLAGTVGLIAGLVLAFLISEIYAQFEIPYLSVILTILTYLILGYLGAFVATHRVAMELAGPGTQSAGKKISQGFLKPNKKGEALPKILDTSVIIDGRIVEIMKTGFIEGVIVIPEFVLLELQYIADSADSLKRNRGRRGLDILKKIQQDYGVEIKDTSKEKTINDIPDVDIKLLKLAKKLNAKVITNDYNLNKVGTIQGIEILNINELANTLKPAVLPGEEMKLFLVKEGKEDKQAVAYLDDGTMIVVENGKNHIGNTIDVTVTSVLQTSAGRMIFGKPSKQD